MYLHGLQKEDSRTSPNNQKIIGQVLCVTLFSEAAKVALLIFLQLGDMRGCLLLADHGTCDTKLDHNRQWTSYLQVYGTAAN